MSVLTALRTLLPASSVHTLSMSTSSLLSLFDIHSVSDVSSNETASDLPGPGRNLGNAYSYLGRRFERVISNLIDKRRPESPGIAVKRPSNSLSSEGYAIGHVGAPLMAMPDIHSSLPDIVTRSVGSTNETASDLPGPGRNLGNLYSYLGIRIENISNSIAERIGKGPNNVAEKITGSLEDREHCKDCEPNHNPLYKCRQLKDCKKLIRYTKWVSLVPILLHNNDWIVQLDSGIHTKTSFRQHHRSCV